jgi:hypothetical protein
MRPRPHLLIILLFLCACAGQTTATQTDTQEENHLLRLLSYVPDSEGSSYIPNIYYGDIAAWHTAWGIPRIDNAEDWKALEIHPRNYWDKILPVQIPLPMAGRLLTGRYSNQRSFYGFDLFNTERVLHYNSTRALVELSSTAGIGDTLVASGYETTSLDGATLYSYPDPKQRLKNGEDLPVKDIAITNEAPVLIINSYIDGTPDDISPSIAAHDGDTPSLAQNPAYISAALALEDEYFDDMGELTGAVLLNGLDFPFNTPGAAAPIKLNANERQAYVENLIATYPPLAEFSVAVFATYHSPGATYEVILIVYPEGEDALAAARSVEARLRDYISFQNNQNLLEYMELTIDTVGSIESAGLPVAILALRANDPPLEYGEDEILVLPNTVPTYVPDWFGLEQLLDFGFIIPIP